MRWIFDNVWHQPYRMVTAEQIKRGLKGIDVLVVPDGYSNYALQALGQAGKRALREWVDNGGRYVGWQAGARVAIRSHLSTAVLSGTHANAPGTLVRAVLDRSSPLAAGIGRSVWVMYDDDDTMASPSSIGRFPHPGAPAYATSGLAENMDQLAGTSIAADEQFGNGRVITFAIDPNFRAWTLGTLRMVWNAINGPDPSKAEAARSVTPRPLAVSRAVTAERQTPEGGDAVRIAVPKADAAKARAALRGLDLRMWTVKESGLRVLTIANVQAKGLEESRTLSRVLPKLQHANITIKWAHLPGP
jgi:hypothetical protein